MKTQPKQELSRADRIRGCLLLGAVGDALGYRVEFEDWKSIRNEHGPAGVTTPIEEGRAIVSDDTQMAMFTVEGLIRAWVRFDLKGICHPPTIVWFAYLRWLATQGVQVKAECWELAKDSWLLNEPSLRVRRAPGNTCITSLGSGNMGTVAEPINHSKGCGTVMRVAPVGLTGSLDAFVAGAEVSALTHGHDTGILAGAALSLMIDRLMRGDDLDSATSAALDALRNAPTNEELIRDRPLDPTETIAALEQALACDGPPTPASIEALGGGWVAEEALAIALHCVRNAATPFDALIASANHSGDSDSTAAIAGNLLGVMHGPGVVPHEWIASLDVGDALHDLIEDFIVGFSESFDAEAFWDRYPGY